ncbi:molybdate ABC transporter substrate-binding protein [Dermabacteraceae bacterium TAE3-ERU27]|nr:molybdate ABC transporter substrate-binding protein [Dermabacteraceae bacterium TAE3-ERU27]
MPIFSRRNLFAAAGSICLAAGISACSGKEKQPAAGSEQTPASGAGEGKTLTVFAAASLQKTFAEIAKQFEAETGAKVLLSTAGSTALVTQLEGGAPADVLATANLKTMKSALEKGLIVGEPENFASNRLVIAVAPGNPKGVKGLADLTGATSVVRCAPQVPCGTASDKVLADPKITLTPVSEENSVTDVLTKVTTGQADTGLVYATDIARADGKAEAVQIAEAGKFLNTYPIAQVKGSAQPELGKQFIAYVLSAKGQEVLQNAGFGAPDAK